MADGVDEKLHRICNEGKLEKIREYMNTSTGGKGGREEVSYDENNINKGTGMYNYTPLHEAAANDKYKVIDFLINQGAKINVRASNGRTPLHVAAYLGHVQSVRTLLRHNADVTLLDDKGETAKELTNNNSIVRLIRGEEIVNAAKSHGDNLTELLRVKVEELEPNCLERALMAAVQVDNHFNIGKLIIKGATLIKEALQRAQEGSKYNACAMLLLVLAAQENDRELVLKLFGGAHSHPMADDYNDFDKIQEVIMSGRVSTIIAIEIARRHQNALVREELILHTDANREEGTVYWHGLRLLTLDVSWLRKIQWVKKLRLARNGFRSIPSEIGGYLKQLTKLDLQHNDLTTIPHCLLQLPSLNELILSHNRIHKIPSVTKWSPNLSILNLSHNELTTLPSDIIAPSLHTLNLSNNHFSSLPTCLSFLTSLQNLSLAHNKDIFSLPNEMGRLINLTKLDLDGLDHLTDPPRSVQKDTRECIRYLDSKLRSPQKVYQMKLLLLGNSNAGKTTLASRLQGLDVDPKRSRTNGININEWLYSAGFFQQKYQFNIYDFGSLENSSAPSLSQCFYSDSSLYVLVWRIQHGETGIAELRPWLDSISSLKGSSNPTVLIVGTCLDLFDTEERTKVDDLLGKVAVLSEEYSHCLNIAEILAVGLEKQLENLNQLKKCIYTHAANCKNEVRPGSDEISSVMGREVPSNYLRLSKEVKELQIEVYKNLRPPVMHVNQFKAFVSALKFPDIVTNDEILSASLFLKDIGTISYYNDTSYGLDELYFIDPSWLYSLMSAITKSPSIENGLLQCQRIPKLFQSSYFQWQYRLQYFFLMDRYGIAVPLDSEHLLIPCMLPSKCAVNDVEDVLGKGERREGGGEGGEEGGREGGGGEGDKASLPYTRYFIFHDTKHVVPSCFWSRLLSHIIYKIPQVHHSLLSSTHKDTSPSSSLLPTNKKELENQSSSHHITTANASTLDFKLSYVYNSSQNKEIDEINKFGEVFLWREGIVYKNQNVSFSVKSFTSFDDRQKQKRKGIQVSVSPNQRGFQLLCQLIDIIRILLNECYPVSSCYQEIVPCPECRKSLLNKDPYEFKIDQSFLSHIYSNINEVHCECSHPDDPSTSVNHTVLLKDIIPDLLLCDIEASSSEVLFSPETVTYLPDSLIATGCFSKVYTGSYKDNTVAVKEYISNTTEDLLSLRSEALMLFKARTHPFVVNLVGVIYHPNMRLVLEISPLGSLQSCLIKRAMFISRIIIHRIAIQVASALQFLHSQGIVHRDVKASNVLLWSLEEDTTCNAKLAGSSVSLSLSSLGLTGLKGTKGFMAPEIIRAGQQRNVYNHKVDVFSYGMLLYQMITRRFPFHNVQPTKIDSKIIQGERPSYTDVPLAENSYFFMTRLMEMCWNQDPNKRPEMDDIIVYLSQIIRQCIMSVCTVQSRYSLRCACNVNQDTSLVSSTSDRGEFWICSDNSEGTELSVYNGETMTKLSKTLISGNQVQCVRKCGNHVWVCSRSGIEYGVIDIFGVQSHELIHNIRLRESTVSCMTCSVDSDTVYIGTLEGHCFSFDTNITAIQSQSKPHYCYVSEHAIDGIIATTQHVWIAHTYYVFFLNLNDLKVEHSYKRNPKMDAFVGHLAPGSSSRIWSAHLGGCVFSSWDSAQETLLFDVNVYQVMKTSVSNEITKSDAVITCMTPALDVVWVGMATGHILLFHDDNLLTFVHPYKEYVRFLVPIPTSGEGSNNDKCMIVSGAKGFQSSLLLDCCTSGKSSVEIIQESNGTTGGGSKGGNEGGSKGGNEGRSEGGSEGGKVGGRKESKGGSETGKEGSGRKGSEGGREGVVILWEAVSSSTIRQLTDPQQKTSSHCLQESTETSNQLQVESTEEKEASPNSDSSDDIQLVVEKEIENKVEVNSTD